jgi:sec-independent protein translocase protein TatB
MQTAAQEVEQSIKQEISRTQSELVSSWQGKDEVVDSPYMTEQYIAKVKSFRRKKLVRQSALPAWYKNRHGHAQRVVSGAARMSRHRVASKALASFF